MFFQEHFVSTQQIKVKVTMKSPVRQQFFSFKKLLTCCIKLGLSNGRYSTPTKIDYGLGKNISIKMLSMLCKKSWLMIIR